MNKEPKKPRKKKKKRVRKLFVSTAAFITAAVIIIFCIYYVYFQTDYFNITNVHVKGNETYNEDYIVSLSNIELGEKIFSIDRSKIQALVEKEVYVKNARVVYELPDKILIELTERKEKYQVYYKNEYIVVDENGIVLKVTKEKNDLLTIESLADVLYNVGETLQITGIENINTIFDTVNYVNSEFGGETVKKLFVDSSNSFVLQTEYGTYIKIKLKEDIKYQIVFAMKIINERLNNNLVVSNGIIDFTKGDSPVYIEDFKMEEYNE